jgi:hypothetical protein
MASTCSTEDVWESAKSTTFLECFGNLVYHCHANKDDVPLSVWPKQNVNMTSDHFKHFDNTVC